MSSVERRIQALERQRAVSPAGWDAGRKDIASFDWPAFQELYLDTLKAHEERRTPARPTRDHPTNQGAQEP